MASTGTRVLLGNTAHIFVVLVLTVTPENVLAVAGEEW